ncbi:MAG TPA: SGNH/GDSL hydrolase family protein [Vicinamibacterales bacterium]|nr:SGNH/GDSL hydrolase family protein [Vicinamibacterales bacterium]
MIVAFTSACARPPTAPSDTSRAAIVATISEGPLQVPPRIGALPPPPALGGTKFVAFGDSITSGTLSSFDGAFLYDAPAHSYPTRVQLALRHTFPLQAAAFTVVNAGAPGERALEGRQRVAGVLRTYDPDGLLLLEGINDMTFGGSALEAAAAVVGIIDVARTHHVTVLVGLMPQTYASVYPNGETRTQAAERVVPFNNEVRRLTAGMQNVHIVDLYAQFGNNRSLMGADGLHPTEAGYELMAATFVEAIETIFPVRGSLQ